MPASRSDTGGEVPKRANHSRDDLRILAALSDIGVALGGSQDLRSALERILEKLEVGRGIVRGAVFLLHEDTGEIHVEAAVGIPSEGMRARYRPGEGIIGRVVQSGRPVTVPATGREPLLMDRAFQRRACGVPEASFVAVPIVLERRPAGALAPARRGSP
jgi:Nif-specific regulatory protein